MNVTLIKSVTSVRLLDFNRFMLFPIVSNISEDNKMNSKYVSYFLIIALFLISARVAPAINVKNQSGDWNSLSNRLNQEIAVKAQNKKTIFGILTDFSGDEISVQSESQIKTAFKRDEVEKIWLAKLKGDRNTGKGALIGAGTGAAAGLIYVVANRESGDGQLAVAVPVLAVYGAGIGAAIGFFARSRNQKKQLIYQR